MATVSDSFGRGGPPRVGFPGVVVERWLWVRRPLAAEAAIVAAKESKRPLAIGMKAPDFKFMDMDGKKVSLSEFRGEKVVFVNMWATWCPPCIWEMPLMEKLYRKLKLKFQIRKITESVGPYLGLGSW